MSTQEKLTSLTAYAYNGDLVQVEGGPLLDRMEVGLLLEQSRIELEEARKEIESLRFKAECLENYVQELLAAPREGWEEQ